MAKELAFEPYDANFVAGRGESKLLLDGENYLYVLTEAKYGRWLCRKRRQEKCNGAAYVKDGKITKVVEHNHPASVTEVTVMTKKQAVLASIEANPQVATKDLVTNLMEICTATEEHSYLALKKSFARQIQRKKAKILQKPGKPTSLDNLDTLPSSCYLTCDGQHSPVQLIEGFQGLEAKTQAQCEDSTRMPPSGTPIHRGSNDIDELATNSQCKLSISRNVLLHIEDMDKVALLERMSNFKERNDSTK